MYQSRDLAVNRYGAAAALVGPQYPAPATVVPSKRTLLARGSRVVESQTYYTPVSIGQ